jgi:hypothetical protein
LQRIVRRDFAADKVVDVWLWRKPSLCRSSRSRDSGGGKLGLLGLKLADDLGCLAVELIVRPIAPLIAAVLFLKPPKEGLQEEWSNRIIQCIVQQSLFRILFKINVRRAAGFQIRARPSLSVAAVFALGHGFNH